MLFFCQTEFLYGIPLTYFNSKDNFQENIIIISEKFLKTTPLQLYTLILIFRQYIGQLRALFFDYSRGNFIFCIILICKSRIINEETGVIKTSFLLGARDPAHRLLLLCQYELPINMEYTESLTFSNLAINYCPRALSRGNFQESQYVKKKLNSLYNKCRGLLITILLFTFHNL